MKKRGSSRYFVFFIFITLVIFLVFWGVKSLIGNLSFFEIEEIEIVGNVNLETDFLQSFVRDLSGKNLFKISKKEILKKYENIVRLKDIKVYRIIPVKLKLKIIERIGVFYLKTSEGELFPIDEDQIVLDNDSFYLSEILPIIETDIDKKDLFIGMKIEHENIKKVFEFWKEIKSYDENFIHKISEFYIDDKELIMIEANMGYEIIFGEEDIENKLKRFTFLEQNRGFEKGDIIDLRFSNSLIIRTEEK